MEWYPCNYSEYGTENKTVTFIQAEQRENIKSRENHKTLFGKIARWFADLKTVAFTGSYSDLTGKPSSMPASDVHAWAKAASKPSYNWGEIGSKPSTFQPSSHTHAFNILEVGGGHTVAGGSSLVVGSNNKSSKWQSATVGYGCVNGGYNGLVTGYCNTVDETGGDTSSMLVAGENLHTTGKRGVVFGYYNNAKHDQTVTGHYSNDTLMAEPGQAVGTAGTAFAIGNGYSGSRSNAFRVDYNGTVYSKGSYNTTGADYAEYFEWADGNPGSEDRTGLFVTLEGDKIMPAHEGDYILGIISANPSVTGNSDEHWAGQFKKDVFNRYVIEERPVTVKEIKMETLADGNGNPVSDKNGNPVITVKEEEKECMASTYVENEDYDRDKVYIHRADRPEWATVGLLGQLVCCDDGTCQVNGYCKCSQNGMATAATFGEGGFQMPVYRVMERVSENLVKVLVK
ncbi:MAG: hypothetical protein HFH67_14180 [Lachnospiraceae bacterium]|nr:hypothetical protein [Lachnospiraceae bacterium]